MANRKRLSRAEQAERERGTPPGSWRMHGEVGCAHGVEKQNRCRLCENETERSMRVLGVKMSRDTPR